MENNFIVTTIVSIATGISAFIYGVRKDKKDLVSQSLKNLEYQITVYEKIIDSLRNEVANLVKKIDEQEITIMELERKIDMLTNNGDI